jgi:hypothetical protein
VQERLKIVFKLINTQWFRVKLRVVFQNRLIGRSLLNSVAYDSLRESVTDFLKVKRNELDNPEIASAGEDTPELICRWPIVVAMDGKLKTDLIKKTDLRIRGAEAECNRHENAVPEFCEGVNKRNFSNKQVVQFLSHRRSNVNNVVCQNLTAVNVTDAPPTPGVPTVVSSVVDMSPRLAFDEHLPNPFDNRFEVSHKSIRCAGICLL